MGDYAAEIAVRSDGEAEREEITNYDEVQDYLANGTYPEGATVAAGISKASAYAANKEFPVGASHKD